MKPQVVKNSREREMRSNQHGSTEMRAANYTKEINIKGGGGTRDERAKWTGVLGK